MALLVDDDVGGVNHLLSKSNLRLTPLPHKDRRSDQEIVSTLIQPPPVSSEKNVWAFWNTGFASMRPWAQRNVIGWVRLLGPSWTVRVLDLVDGSAANAYQFIGRSNVPATLREGKMSGRFAGHHASDMIRLPCLYEHGGVYMDVGIMLFMHLDDVCWNKLEDPASKFEVALASADPSLTCGMVENFFIAGRKKNSFLGRWMNIFLEIWQGRTSCEGVHSHPLFHHIVVDGNLSRFFKIASGDKLDYFAHQLAYERLRLLEDPYDGFNGPSFCRSRILLLEYREFALAAMLTNNDGQKQFDLLKTRTDEDINGPRYQEAQTFCDRLLAETAMIKLYHWQEEGPPTLADLWDQPGNEKTDHDPGTFAEYLRFVSTHYTQQRQLTAVKYPRVSEDNLVAGVLEWSDE